MEDGIHEIDIMHGMIGARVARIYASGGNSVLTGRETIDHAGIVIDYENGVKFTFNFSLFARNAGPISRHMVLVGTEGILQPEHDKISIRRQSGSDAKLLDANVDASGAKQAEATYREYIAFAHSLRTGEKPMVSGTVGKEAIKISLLAEKSLRERRIVSWNDLPA